MRWRMLEVADALDTLVVDAVLLRALVADALVDAVEVDAVLVEARGEGGASVAREPRQRRRR